MTLLLFFWNQPVTVPPPRGGGGDGQRGGGMDTGGGGKVLPTTKTAVRKYQEKIVSSSQSNPIAVRLRYSQCAFFWYRALRARGALSKHRDRLTVVGQNKKILGGCNPYTDTPQRR